MRKNRSRNPIDEKRKNRSRNPIDEKLTKKGEIYCINRSEKPLLKRWDGEVLPSSRVAPPRCETTTQNIFIIPSQIFITLRDLKNRRRCVSSRLNIRNTNTFCLFAPKTNERKFGTESEWVSPTPASTTAQIKPIQ